MPERKAVMWRAVDAADAMAVVGVGVIAWRQGRTVLVSSLREGSLEFVNIMPRIAIGVIEAGMCKTVVIFRSMNGYSQVRIGGTGVRSAIPVSGDMLHGRAYGWQSAGQMLAPT